MRLFYSSGWPRSLQVSRMLLMVSMVLAIFQLPAHAQGNPSISAPGGLGKATLSPHTSSAYFSA